MHRILRAFVAAVLCSAHVQVTAKPDAVIAVSFPDVIAGWGALRFEGPNATSHSYILLSIWGVAPVDVFKRVT